MAFYLPLRNQRGRRTSGNNSEQVVPPADDVTGVSLDQLLEGDAHLLLDCAGGVHVA